MEQGRGLESQANDADAWCAARDLQIDDSLSDAGVSAFKGDNVAKGALGRFLAMAQAGDLGDDSILPLKQLTDSAGKRHSTARRMFCSVLSALAPTSSASVLLS